MKDRPILFSGQMVRAILDGRKSQTRRVMKLPDHEFEQAVQIEGVYEWILWSNNSRENAKITQAFYKPGEGLACPYGQPGDRLWVRETWQMIYERRDGQRFTHPIEGAQKRWIEYAASPRDEHEPPKWKPSIFMPRWASRITLEVVMIRVERLQEITRDDAKAEGVSNLWNWNKERNAKHPEHFVRGVLNPYIANYSVLWDEINGKGSWDTNPWVWVIEFKKAEVRNEA